MQKTKLFGLSAFALAFAFNASAVINMGPAATTGAPSSTVSVPVNVVRGLAADPANFASATFSIDIPQAAVTAVPTFTAASSGLWAGANIGGTIFNTNGANYRGVFTFTTSGAPPFLTVGQVYTIGNISVPVGATLPVALTATFTECTDNTGTKLTAGTCTATSSSITAIVGGTGALTPATLTYAGIQAGGTPSANQNGVITASGGPFSYTTCTITGAGAANFAFNTLPAAQSVPVATPLNIPVRFAPPAGATVGATTATLQCAGATGTTTLNGQVLGGNTVAQSPATLAFGSVAAGASSANQNLVLTAPAGNTGAVAVSCSITGADAALFGFNPAPTFPVSVAAGATVNIPTRFNPPAATTVGAKTASVACTTATVGASVTGSPTALTGTVTAPVAAVSAVTAPPGPVAIAVPVNASGTSTLTFNVANAAGALACVVSGGTGVGTFTASPNPLNLVVGTPGNVTVTYAGGTAGGTGSATLTCTPVAPATGGPFVYTLNGTTQAPSVAIPTLSDMGKLLLVAAMLGFGLVLVGRRNA